MQSRKAKGLSLRTIDWYQEILTKFSIIYNKLPKKADELDNFIASLSVGDERRHGYYRALKAFYRFLNRRRYIRYNPFVEIEPPKIVNKEPPILMPDDINLLLQNCQDSKIKASLMFLTDTGCRLGELATITTDKLDETPWGFVARVSGKKGTRIVPISYETYHALMVNLPFKWSKDWLGRKISDYCKSMGVKAGALTFRHSFASLWLGDELILQQIMGHTTLATTKRYRHLRTQLISRQHSEFTPLRMVLGSTKSLL